ncbi:MAG: hypothetical protein WBA43_12420 [Elainellaceae cyanobacterium]
MVNLSFWLMPKEEHRIPLAILIEQLSDRFQSTPFTPHVTLGSGAVPWAIADLPAHLDPLVKTIPPLSLKTEPPQTSDRFSKTLFIPLPTTPALTYLVTSLQQTVPASLTGCNQPHISLLYKTGVDAAAIAASLTLPLATVTFSELWAIAAPQQFESQADVQQLHCLYRGQLGDAWQNA